MQFLFPIIQSIHLVGLVLLVGTIAITDLSSLGLVRISANLAPWTSTGLVTMGVTGPLLFLLDWHRYLNNPAFLAKMVILTLALITHFTLDRGKHRKIAALLSLILWVCVVLAGRAIADFDIPGV
jgi:hypothetical protein